MPAQKLTPTDYYTSYGSRIGYQLVLGGTKHFGLFQPGDSRWNFKAAMRRTEDLLGRTLDLPKGSRVLDAGCGMGDVAHHLANRFDYRVDGIDILDFNVAEATHKSRVRHTDKQTTFQLMDYSDLDFPDASFDGVYTMETLVHAEDPAAVLAEFHRVLKPGGKIVLFEYAYDSTIPAAQRTMLSKINELASMPAFELFTDDTLEQMLAKSGFQHIAATDITEQMLPMVHSFAQMASLPYALAKLLGLTDKSVNMMSAVEFWKMREWLHYRVYVGRKD